MPILIPPYLGEEINSNAEKKIYKVLQDLNLKNAYVLHSLGLPKHNSKIYGEIDFVIVCDRGVAVLEVKGGRVECRDGSWIFTDRRGIEREKAEGPFAQVTGNMFSLRNSLRVEFRGNHKIKNVLMACGVFFPDIEFTSSSLEIIPEIVFDNTTDDITDYINQIFDYWQERSHRKPSTLAPGDIKLIVDYLRGNFVFVPTLSDRLDTVDEKLIRLTSEQVKVMDSLSLNDHLLIEGSAGTGKTLLAVDYSKKQEEMGKKVLYLTYNKNLAYKINNYVERYKNLKVINIHALFGEYVSVNQKMVEENSNQYFGETLPEEFYNYLTDLSEDELSIIQYDLIIMDEGQDLMRPSYLYPIDLMLRGGFENGHWTVFYDKDQNIYNPEYQDGLDLLLSYNSTKFKLFVNCRNTVQIGIYCEKISGIEISEYIGSNGEEVQQIKYSDKADFKRQINKILQDLRIEKVDMRDVTFLSPKKYRNSMLSEVIIKVNEVSDDFDPQLNLPRYATIQGYKGLDSKIIILIDVEKIIESNFHRYTYIAGTRARTLLYIVADEKWWWGK